MPSLIADRRSAFGKMYSTLHSPLPEWYGTRRLTSFILVLLTAEKSCRNAVRDSNPEAQALYGRVLDLCVPPSPRLAMDADLDAQRGRDPDPDPIDESWWLEREDASIFGYEGEGPFTDKPSRTAENSAGRDRADETNRQETRLV